MSRSLITGIIITFLLITGLAIFFYYSYVRVKSVPATEAVPGDAALILSFRNAQKSWGDFCTSDMWKDLQRSEAFGSINREILYADSIIRSIDELKEAVATNRSVVSFHATGSSLHLLYILETNGKLEVQPLLDRLSGLTRCVLSKRSVEKDKVYELLDASRFPVMTFAYANELLICSAEGSLVEESLRKLRYHIPNSTKGFEQARGMAEVNGEMSLFVNYQRLPDIMRLLTKPEHSQLFDYLRAFANWSLFDLKLGKEEISISGISYTDDSLFQFLDLFKTQQPQEFSMAKYIPRNAAMITSFTFSDYPKFNTDLNEYLQNRGKLEGYIRFADSIENRYNIELNEKLLPLLGPEAALVMLESPGSDYEQQLFALLKFSNADDAEAVLGSYISSMEKRGESDSASISYHGFTLRRLKLGNFLKLYYGGAFEKIYSPYFTRIGEVFVFANEAGTLRGIVDQVASGNVLDKDETFRKYQSRSANAANITFFFNPSRCLLLPETYVNDEFFSVLNRYQYDFRKFEYVTVQYANTNNSAFYTNINLKFTPSFREETRILWAAALDTTFVMPPAVIYNEVTRQNVILVQDVNSTVYLLSNSGSILWRSRIDGPILSPVYTVDPTNNGSFRYLFNTEKQAYLINSKGVSERGYPFSFPGTATASLGLADIHGDSSLSFFVPLKNKRIAGYRIDGKALPGWNPRQVDEKVVSPLRSFRLGHKFYLYATGESGHMLLFQEHGEKVTAQSMTTVAGLPFFHTSADTSRMEWIAIDSTGRLHAFAADSSLLFTEVTSTALPQVPGYFLHSAGPDPGTDLFLAGNRNQWMLLDRQGHKLVGNTVADTMAIRPFFTQLASGQAAVGTVSPQEGKVYLYRAGNALYPGFPMEGSTVFTISNLMLDGNNYLLVGDGNKSIKLFRLK